MQQLIIIFVPCTWRKPPLVTSLMRRVVSRLRVAHRSGRHVEGTEEERRK